MTPIQQSEGDGIGCKDNKEDGNMHSNGTFNITLTNNTIWLFAAYSGTAQARHWHGWSD